MSVRVFGVINTIMVVVVNIAVRVVMIQLSHRVVELSSLHITLCIQGHCSPKTEAFFVMPRFLSISF